MTQRTKREKLSADFSDFHRLPDKIFAGREETKRLHCREGILSASKPDPAIVSSISVISVPLWFNFWSLPFFTDDGSLLFFRPMARLMLEHAVLQFQTMTDTEVQEHLVEAGLH